MKFDERNRDPEQCIPNRNRRMRESTRVYDDAVCPVRSCLLDPVDDCAFPITGGTEVSPASS